MRIVDSIEDGIYFSKGSQGHNKDHCGGIPIVRATSKPTGHAALL